MSIEDKVDLFTESDKLQDLMLGSYPGELDPTYQYRRDTSFQQPLHQFFNLPKNKILKFLEKIDPKIKREEYEVRDSLNGEFVRIRKCYGKRGLIIDDIEIINKII
jgi:hypothetical protein